MTSNKKMLFLINPVAGKSTLGNSLVEIIDLFVKNGYDIKVRTTQSSDDIKRTVIGEGENYDLIVCCGGDGTLNRTAGAMLKLAKRPALGYIPAGTVNDFAHSHSIPRNALEAAMRIVNGEETYIDTGSFMGRTFLYVAAFGVFTGVSYQTSQDMKNQLGRLAYVVEGIKSLATITPYHIRFEHDGGVIEGDFIYAMVTNSSSVGGFNLAINRDYSFNDGLMEVTLVREPKTPQEVTKLLNALISQKADDDLLFNFQTKRISYTSASEIAWTLDGESGGKHKGAQIEVRENLLKMKY